MATRLSTIVSTSSLSRQNWSVESSEFSTSGRINVGSIGASRKHELVSLVSRRATRRSEISRNANLCRAGGQDKYGQCKCMEDAVTAIMKDAIQHCLNKECDVMRDKVMDQMGKGLAALVRVSVGVAAVESNASIPIPTGQLGTIKEEDLEQVRRMLQLTSLPFHNAYDDDLNRLMNMLQTGDGQDRRLTASELSQVCDRLGSDLVQCLGPLALCFPELPLWAKHRALMLPAEVASKMAFSLLAGPLF